jgi:integrase
VHPKVVQERLGHSQISVTLDTYSHVLPALQVEAASKFDQLLQSKARAKHKTTLSAS